MTKFFRTTNVSRKRLRTLCCKFAKSLGVKRIIFNDRGKYVKGTYNCFNKIMYINTDQSNNEILQAVFHELGHHQAILEEKWIDYHFNEIKEMSGEDIFEIENGIDQLAEKLWAKYVDCKVWGRYKYAYPRSQKTQIINEFINIYSK